jgi:hypothetical protein
VEHEFDFSTTPSYGKVTAKIGLDGPVDSPAELGDRLLATVAAFGSIEGLRMLNGHANGKSVEQECTVNFSFGDISMLIKIGVSLNHDISNRTLNKLVCVEIISRLWAEAAAHFSGQKLDNPSARSLSYIDAALNLNTAAVQGQGQHGSRRSRQQGAGTNGSRHMAPQGQRGHARQRATR